MTEAGPLRCSTTARLAGDPMIATAPPAEHWLLVEHGGPWGRRAIADSGLDRVAVAAFADWTRGGRARVALVRRPGAPRGDGTPRRWFVVDARPGHESARHGLFTGERELVDVLAARAPGEPWPGPIHLVCAHGRHDACCAIRGRPVAAELAARFGDHVWECSHVGGDRFAANLVLLPHGLYYGQVGPRLAVDLAERYARGQVHPELLRGRSSLPAPAQAAQHFARLATGQHGVDAHAVKAVVQREADCWSVQLDGPVTVHVRSRIVRTGRALTCSDTQPGSYRTFDLVGLDA